MRKGHISQSPLKAKGLNLYRPNDQEVLLTPAEVASLFRVDPKTVTRWAKAGKLTAIRTLGGHRRYRQSSVAFESDLQGGAPDGALPREIACPGG